MKRIVIIICQIYFSFVFYSCCGNLEHSCLLDEGSKRPDFRNNHSIWKNEEKIEENDYDDKEEDDDDDEEDNRNIYNLSEKRIEEMRNAKEELDNQCKCIIPEYETINSFINLDYEKTLMHKNIIKITKELDKDNHWILKALFIYCPWRTVDELVISEDETLQYTLPVVFWGDAILNEILCVNGSYTLSTIAILEDYDKKLARVIVVNHRSNDVIYDFIKKDTSIIILEKYNKFYYNYRNLREISSSICNFEIKTSQIGPSCFESFLLFLDQKDIDLYMRKHLNNDRYNIRRYLIDNIPCWLVNVSTYLTLSRTHVPKMMWTGPYYYFIVDANTFKIKKVKRQK